MGSCGRACMSPAARAYQHQATHDIYNARGCCHAAYVRLPVPFRPDRRIENCKSELASGSALVLGFFFLSLSRSMYEMVRSEGGTCAGIILGPLGDLNKHSL